MLFVVLESEVSLAGEDRKRAARCTRDEGDIADGVWCDMTVDSQASKCCAN